MGLLDWQGRILLSLKKTNNISKIWEFPGGKIKQNETPHKGAIRELKEELGILIKQENLQPYTFKVHEYKNFTAVIFFYICRTWKNKPNPKEKQKILWVQLNQLNKYKMHSANTDVILDLSKKTKKSL